MRQSESRRKAKFRKALMCKMVHPSHGVNVRFLTENAQGESPTLCVCVCVCVCGVCVCVSPQ